MIAAGCTLQGSCDAPPVIDYCNPAKPNANQTCNAALKSPYDWYSNPINKQWVKFPAFGQIYMFLKDPAGNTFVGTPDEVVPYVATNETGDDAVIAAGNLAVHRACPDNAPCIILTNETCVGWYLRVVVHTTSTGMPDAATDAPTEAGPDAGSDAPTD